MNSDIFPSRDLCARRTVGWSIFWAYGLSALVLASPSFSVIASVQMIATFDNPPLDSIFNWNLQNGSEFPGALGELTEGGGSVGKGAKLTYSFSCGMQSWTVLLNGQNCGRYVAMQLNRLPSSLVFTAKDVPTIAFDVRNLQATASPNLRIIDSTGQTLQFKASARPIENVQGTQWARVQVAVERSATHWGGANDGKTHLPIKALAVMADEVALPSPSGAMEVDNITYLSSPDTEFNLTPDAVLSGQSYPSSYIGRLGVVWRPKFGYAALDKATAVGLNVVRFDLNWQSVEARGKFDFSYYSGIASELAKRKVKVLFILCYGHPDHGGAVPLSPGDQAAFGEFARRAAVALKGPHIAGFEVWNEPNMSGFWPKKDPLAYSRLVAAAVKGIRSADAAVPIVTAGIADTDFAYLMAMLRSGNLDGVSALGVHPYRLAGPETFAAQVPTLNQMMAAVGLNVPLWDTEWGYSSVRDVGEYGERGDGHDDRALRRQAVLNLRRLLTAIALNLPISVLYELVDEGGNARDREHNFGILNKDLSDKPAMTAVRALYAAQNGRALKGFLPKVPPGLHVLRWDGVGDKVFVLWSDAPGEARTKVTLPGGTSSVQVWDGSTPPTLTRGGQFYLQEADGPVFVRVPN